MDNIKPIKLSVKDNNKDDTINIKSNGSSSFITN